MLRFLKVAGLFVGAPAALMLALLRNYIEWAWWTPLPVLLIFGVPVAVGAIIYRVAFLVARMRGAELGCGLRAVLGLVSGILVGYGLVMWSPSGQSGGGTDHGGSVVAGWILMTATAAGLIAGLFGAGLGQVGSDETDSNRVV